MPVVPNTDLKKVTPRGIKAGPRRPSGGYENNTKTLSSPGVGLPANNRTHAKPLVPGPKINDTDGRSVTTKKKSVHDAALDGVPRTIIN